MRDVSNHRRVLALTIVLCAVFVLFFAACASTDDNINTFEAGGEATTNQPSGQSRVSELYLVTQPLGIGSGWGNGARARQIGYLDANGEFKPHGYSIVVGADGTPLAAGVQTSDGEQGKWVGWHANGNVHWVGTYSNGERYGRWAYWNENWSLVSEGYYTSGKADGEWIFYHDNGLISSRGVFRKDHKVGKWERWYSNGALKSSGRFVRPEKYEGMYAKSLKHGEWRYYSKSGELTKVVVYNFGREVG